MLQNSKAIPAEVLQRLREVIASGVWHNAKTYPAHLAHSYCMRKEFPVVWMELNLAVIEYGFDADFFGHPHRYVIVDDHKYWCYDILVNREEIGLSEARLLDEVGP